MGLLNDLRLAAPKTIYFLGFFGVGLAIIHLAQTGIAASRGSYKFDPGYSLADEALAFAGAATLLIAERLDALNKRLKNLEEKHNVNQSRPDASGDA